MLSQVRLCFVFPSRRWRVKGAGLLLKLRDRGWGRVRLPSPRGTGVHWEVTGEGAQSSLSVWNWVSLELCKLSSLNWRSDGLVDSREGSFCVTTETFGSLSSEELSWSRSLSAAGVRSALSAS